MNILITGANGFIGKELVKKFLKDNCNVFAIVTDETDMTDLFCEKLTVIKLFFPDYNKIANLVRSPIDIAYHLAWDGLSGDKAQNVDMQLNNVSATCVLFDNLKKLGIKKIVLASSMNVLEVYDYLKNPLRLEPRGVYIHVAAKINAEIVLRTLCEKNNIAFNTAILAMVYGENNKSKMIINTVIESLLQGESPRLIKGENEYDVIYVKDAANGLYMIGKNGYNKKTYYIGHNWSKSFKQIIIEIRNIVNPNVDLKFGVFNEDNHINFNFINRDELTSDTNWKPIYDFQETILSTAKWLKNR